MTATMAPTAARTSGAFRHDALFYSGEADFVDRTASFIRDAVSADEPILVVVGDRKLDLLRSALGGDAAEVRFADMAEVGGNPARIIPAWHEFVAEQSAAGRRFRGVGEPIWASRSAEELVECERHESLLNLAFADAPAWWLACPYDTESLPPPVLEEARRNHPFVLENGAPRPSTVFRDLAEVVKPFDRPLPEPRGPVQQMPFGAGQLEAVRQFVSRHAAACGLGPRRKDDLVLAVNELATNSLRHAGGGGLLRVWRNGTGLVCEVRDDGRIEQPLVGRERPTPDQEGGFGLWLVTQLCDLVQVRSFPQGSVVRIHTSGG
jgi:anti-sigma regulatory factor (Ser/Thr protein kinase)